MNKKRFTFEYDDGQWGVPLFYDDGKKLCFDDVVDLLNEQQSEINSLKMELELISGEKLFSRRELERKVDEQQATIQSLKEENEQLKNKLNKGL